jgi:hypothetical protein
VFDEYLGVEEVWLVSLGEGFPMSEIIILHEELWSNEGKYLLRTSHVRFETLEEYRAAYGEPIRTLPTQRVYQLEGSRQLTVIFDTFSCADWNHADVECLVRMVRRYGRAEVQQIVEAV